MRVFLCLLITAFCLESQQPPATQQAAATLPPQQTPSIKVDVQEVIVPVTVTDDKGKFVSDLVQSDFQIFDQGKLQNIQYFTRERAQPVVVGILMDLSNNSRTHWKNYQEAAIELANTLLPGDKKYSGYLIGYGNEAELMVDTTTDSEKIMEKPARSSRVGSRAV